MDSLTTLYAQHVGRVSHRWSSYLDVYEQTLGPIRSRQLRLLEIGVQNGGSLELWAQYFADAQVIIGCDIDERCGELRFADPRVKVLIGDITTRAVQDQVRATADSLDVIIDDGSHRSPDIINAFVSLYPLLTPGGIYVIEDLHCSYDATFGGGLFFQKSALGFFKRLIDIVNEDHWGLERPALEHLQPLSDRPLPPAFLESLSTLASLEFYDSMCVVRRGDGRRPRIGDRIVVGSTPEVDEAPLAVMGQPLELGVAVESAGSVDPLIHETSIQELLDDRARRIHLEKELREELLAVWERLDRILGSPSYRVMNGPRRLFRALFRRSD
jgi:SAM-dependent methyltransferase